MHSQLKRYHGLVRELADKALTMGEGAAPITKPRGPLVMLGASAARLLLADDPAHHAGFVKGMTTLRGPGRSDGSTGSTGKGAGAARFEDALGFSRPVYHPLLVHLHLAAYALRRDTLAESDADPCRDALADVVRPGRDAILAGPTEPGGERVHQVLWWALCLYECGVLLGDRGGREGPGGPGGRGGRALCLAARSATRRIADHPGEDGALHPRAMDDLLDAWTFREISGMHALARLAMADANADWWERVGQIADHHQALTQPDYTTYQPWAVFAFFRAPATVLFGEQQLHDTATNLHVEQGGAGVVPGLLLADAASAMAEPAYLAALIEPKGG